MISGFQNFLHLTYGLPNGWGSRVQGDGFIPDTGRSRKKRPVKYVEPDRLRAEIDELLSLPVRQAAQQKRLNLLMMLLVVVDD